MTALDYYEITTQVQRDFFESVAVKRTKEIHLNSSVFRYAKIAGNLYFGFKKEKEFFIASPEKALLDAFYLMSYGRYSIDTSALDAGKFNEDEIKRLSKAFPLKTRKTLKIWWKKRPLSVEYQVASTGTVTYVVKVIDSPAARGPRTLFDSAVSQI